MKMSFYSLNETVFQDRKILSKVGDLGTFGKIVTIS